MKVKKSMLTLALALAVLCGITIGASASSTLQEIKAYLNSGITIKYNNTVQTLTDAGGNTVYPITYNGTTYLPVRAVSNMLGIGVDWDQATQTVLLGKIDTRTDLINTFKPYTDFAVTESHLSNFSNSKQADHVQSADKKTISAGGVDLDHWLCLWSGWNNREEVLASYNLGGKYTTLTFQVYADHDTTLTVSGDNGSVLGQYTLKGEQAPQTITVNLLNTTQLTFQRGAMTETDCSVYIFNAYLE